MIKVKHLFDPPDADDGLRIWVEPVGLTRDLQQWCDVDYVLPQLGPPLRAWDELREHPEGYDYFSAKYFAYLAQGSQRATLHQLAAYSATRALTLLHQGEDPHKNPAVVLLEFLESQPQQPADP